MLLFYRAADTIFGRIGRIATEEVVLHLLPVLLRGLEACSLRKTDLDSLDFVVNSLFMKLFHTSNNDTVKECHMFFLFWNTLYSSQEMGRKISETIPEPADYYMSKCT